MLKYIIMLFGASIALTCYTASGLAFRGSQQVLQQPSFINSQSQIEGQQSLPQINKEDETTTSLSLLHFGEGENKDVFVQSEDEEGEDDQQQPESFMHRLSLPQLKEQQPEGQSKNSLSQPEDEDDQQQPESFMHRLSSMPPVEQQPEGQNKNSHSPPQDKVDGGQVSSQRGHGSEDSTSSRSSVNSRSRSKHSVNSFTHSYSSTPVTCIATILKIGEDRAARLLAHAKSVVQLKLLEKGELAALQKMLNELSTMDILEAQVLSYKIGEFAIDWKEYLRALDLEGENEYHKPTAFEKSTALDAIRQFLEGIKYSHNDRQVVDDLFNELNLAAGSFGDLTAIQVLNKLSNILFSKRNVRGIIKAGDPRAKMFKNYLGAHVILRDRSKLQGSTTQLRKA